MDKTVRMALLFDFFGELLTERQRECFDLYYNENLSLSEIAENSSVSRQSVRDTLVRAEQILTDAEEKTGIVARFEQMQKRIAELRSEIDEISKLNETQFHSERLGKMAEDMRKKLQDMEE